MTLGLLVVVGMPLILAMPLVVRPKSRRGPGTATGFFYCPVREQRVRVDFRTAPDGRRIDVAGCGAFAPPTAITCGKLCLRPAEFRRTYLPSRFASSLTYGASEDRPRAD